MIKGIRVKSEKGKEGKRRTTTQKPDANFGVAGPAAPWPSVALGRSTFVLSSFEVGQSGAGPPPSISAKSHEHPQNLVEGESMLVETQNKKGTGLSPVPHFPCLSGSS